MMDGDGTFRHFKRRGSFEDQPAQEIEIYRVIRGEWNHLRNESIQQRSK
jgi:hypothetical protein